MPVSLLCTMINTSTVLACHLIQTIFRRTRYCRSSLTKSLTLPPTECNEVQSNLERNTQEQSRRARYFVCHPNLQRLTPHPHALPWVRLSTPYIGGYITGRTKSSLRSVQCRSLLIRSTTCVGLQSLSLSLLPGRHPIKSRHLARTY